jgi:hypothetical protein
MATNAMNVMDVYSIIEKEGRDKAFWLKLGACFTNRDGSLSVLLDALPKDGKLHIRARNPEREREREQKRDGAVR